MVAEESTFRSVIIFMNKLGFYDVLLPFLLIFTIMFAILEKTRVLGTDKVDNKEYPKRNLNSLVAFVTAFFVIASTRLVAIISQIFANVVLLIILGVSFLLLIGLFLGTGEVKFTKEETMFKFLMAFMGIGVLLIFLNALGWLVIIWEYLRYHTTSNIVGAVILIGVIIYFMFYVTGDSHKSEEPSKTKKDED